MEKYIIKVEPLARKELQKLYKSGNMVAINKVEKIFKELSKDPYHGTGNPEQLKYNLQGKWSRRITPKDRLIYEIHENIITVIILSAKGHYE